MLYRNRNEDEQDFFIGKRNDRLRRVDGTWRLARREVFLDQNVLLAKSLSVFFSRATSSRFPRPASSADTMLPDHVQVRLHTEPGTVGDAHRAVARAYRVAVEVRR